MNLRFLTLILLSVQFTLASEPEMKNPVAATISGKIESMGENIPFANVALLGTTIGTAADAQGNFQLINVPAGNQTVVFSAIGYKPVQKQFMLKSGESASFTIELDVDHIGIGQVVVSANRNAKSRKDAASIVNSLNPKLFERMQSVTLSEGLNFAPGLRMENNCQNCGFSQVRMNGLEGPYSQILINSRPVFSGLAGVYGLELIPVNMIERVEVIRGGGSAMFGSNAIAGTINLITKDPVSSSFSIASSYGSTGTGYATSAIAPDYNLNLNGSFVTEDNSSGLSFYGFQRVRNPFDANNDGYSELSSIENTTLGARVFQRTGSRGKLSLDYFNINEFRRGGNLFELPLHQADIAESTDHVINSGSLHFDQLFNVADKFTTWISSVWVDRGSYYGANQDLSAYGQTDDFSISSGVQYLKNIPRLLFAPATLTAGAEWSYNRLRDKKLGYYDFDTEMNQPNTKVADQRIHSEAVFMQGEWIMKPVTLIAGVRYDLYDIDDLLWNTGSVNGNVVSPRVSLLCDISDELQFRTAFAKGFRAPQIFDEDLHIETSGARQVLHRNDEDLKQETSNSYTVSLDYTRESLFSQYQFLIEGFLTQLNNPFSNDYGQPDENGVVVYTRMNAQDGATVKGVNLEANLAPSRKIQMQSGFTLQKSTYAAPQEFGERRFFRSPSGYGYMSLTLQPHTKFTISGTGTYTGSMLIPYFGPRLQNPEEGILVWTSSFFDASLKVTYDIPVNKTVKIQVNGGVKNIFNSYQDDFDTGINRDPAYMYGPGSPRSVYLGLKFGNF